MKNNSETPRGIVNLDANEMPENALYLNVQCFGMYWKPTRIERMLLKVYNSRKPQMEKLQYYAGVLERRGTMYELQRYKTFATYIEAYAKTMHTGLEITRAFDSFAQMVWDTYQRAGAAHPELVQKWCEELRQQYIFQKSHLYATHFVFARQNMPLFLYPIPYRFQLAHLARQNDLLQTLMGAQRMPRDTQPPFEWGSMEKNVFETQRIVLEHAIVELQKTLF